MAQCVYNVILPLVQRVSKAILSTQQIIKSANALQDISIVNCVDFTVKSVNNVKRHLF